MYSVDKEMFFNRRKEPRSHGTFVRNPSDFPIDSKQRLAIITTGIGLSQQLDRELAHFYTSPQRVSSSNSCCPSHMTPGISRATCKHRAFHINSGAFVARVCPSSMSSAGTSLSITQRGNTSAIISAELFFVPTFSSSFHLGPMSIRRPSGAYGPSRDEMRCQSLRMHLCRPSHQDSDRSPSASK